MQRRTFAILSCVVICVGAGMLFANHWRTAAEEAAPEKPVIKEEQPKVEASSPVKTEKYTKPSDAELSKKLSPIQYHVTQKSGTEPPFQNEYWDNHASGLYVDIVTGEPLFSSKDKFNSGTGWPSFTKPVEGDRVNNLTDSSHGMERTEVRSKTGNSHLGHVFNDGPAPSGTRYCINSASLRFIPVDKLAAEGYGKYRPLIDGHAIALPDATANSCTLPKKGEAASCAATIEVTVLAGGCFWGMQDILRKIPGVISTEVGYCGGSTDTPTYQAVKTGGTNHAESVKITFDKSKLSYADLLENWYFRMHDPTTVNRQGNDSGSQYRSAIFCMTDEQMKIAEEVKARVNASGKWPRPIVTEVVKAGKFTAAEEDHQDYLVKHPGGYTCHYLRDWKTAAETKPAK